MSTQLIDNLIAAAVVFVILTILMATGVIKPPKD
jgi:hypothetical protein